MKINIRNAKLDDSKVVNDFLTQLIKDEKQYDKNINEQCVVYSLYENLIENENNCILVAENNTGEIVGYLYGYIIDSGDAYLKRMCQLEAMFVDETFRGKHIGNKLINHFLIWVKNNDIKYVELKVCNGNKGAISLYEKKGFKNTKSIMMLEIGE